MRVIGVFTSPIPYKELNLNNLQPHCRCKIVGISKGGKLYQFTMETRCLKHIIKYFEWKISNTAIPMNGFKLDYKYNVHKDGSTSVIK